MPIILYIIPCIILGICSYFDKNINPNIFWYWMLMVINCIIIVIIWFVSKD